MFTMIKIEDDKVLRESRKKGMVERENEVEKDCKNNYTRRLSGYMCIAWFKDYATAGFLRRKHNCLFSATTMCSL